MESLMKMCLFETPNNHSTWNNGREDVITLVFQNKALLFVEL